MSKTLVTPGRRGDIGVPWFPDGDGCARLEPDGESRLLPGRFRCCGTFDDTAGDQEEHDGNR